MKKKQLLMLPLLVLLGVSVGLNVYSLPTSTTEVGEKSIHGSSIVVCDSRSNSCERIPEFNIITNQGLNEIANHLFVADNHSLSAFDYLALGNGTEPVAGSESLDTEITTCGLARAQGTVRDIGTGNKSITCEWTSTCENFDVNSTMLLNASSSGTTYAGGTFTDRTLYIDDKINVTIFSWWTSG